MQKLYKIRSIKAGLPPGTLVHIGEKRSGEPKVTLLEYSESHTREEEVASVDSLTAVKPGVTWISVTGLQKVEVLEELGARFGIHPLTMEDILNTDQRPKIEYFDNYIYIVFKILHFDEKSQQTLAEQVSLILEENRVISIQEGQDVFGPLRERIRSAKGRIRKLGADYLAYSLLDMVVDNYFAILEKLGERVEFLEEKLVTNPGTDTLHAIHAMKREMIFLRRSVWPLREVISGLEREKPSLFKESTEVFLRDVYDHTIQVIDTIETFRDILSGMLDIYLSSVSNRMNEIMKVLTIIATLFIPLTFIVGVYGMNFRYMPELEWRWGYPALWLLMISVAVLMLVCFRKKKWL
ncbi:MAG: magnesium/cobalt transporter CorA [Bacillota bacterium]